MVQVTRTSSFWNGAPRFLKGGVSAALLQPQHKNQQHQHNQYHSNDTNLPMDCFLRPSGTVTGAEDEDSSCLTSGVFSEESSGVDSCGAMMVSETSPVEVDIVLHNAWKLGEHVVCVDGHDFRNVGGNVGWSSALLAGEILDVTPLFRLPGTVVVLFRLVEITSATDYLVVENETVDDV